LYVGTTGSGVYTQHWKDGGGSYMEVIGNSTATRKLRIQAFNGSSAYAQWFMDGGNMQIYGDVAGVRNFLIDSTTAYLRWGGGDRLWGGSDGTRNSGWAYHNNNDTGLHWPNNGWHFYPKDVNDMFMRSGSSTNVAIAMSTAGTVRGYVYAENDNTIGFLTNGRGWAFRTYSDTNAQVYGYLGVGQSPNTSYRIITSGDIYLNANGNGWAEGVWKQRRGGGTYYDVIDAGNIGSQSVNYASSAGSASSSTTAAYLPTKYDGYVSNNPQNYFGQTIGLRAAMTGHWSVWSDTLWINGYAGGDVLQMCALHTLRNGQPRIAISAQACTSSTYGTVYELWSSYNMDAPNKSGTSYYQTNTWMQFNGNYGLYWPNNYGAHFYPNNYNSYTQFRLDGNKNGYGGIVDSYSAVSGIMYDSGGNGGVYREANSRWYWYYHLGNACMGVNTSTTSSSYAMYVNGNIYATGDITAYSDRRKKTNITTIDNALNKVSQLRGVFYDKIDEVEKGRQTGVIAQEINEVLPEVVTYAADVDEYGVKYGNIVGVLIEAIKEQQQQIEDLKQQINYLVDNK
jgi:hypothetical protein